MRVMDDEAHLHSTRQEGKTLAMYAHPGGPDHVEDRPEDRQLRYRRLGDEKPTPVAVRESEQTTFIDAPAPSEIAKDAGAQSPPRPDPERLERMSEHVERHEELFGTTYKIKPSTLDHALYVTINDIVLNEGTTHEVRRPFEVFINSKNMEQFEWIVALTRLASAVFRKGGNLEFMVEELKSVYAPQGGYWKPGAGQYMNSVVAECSMAASLA